MFRTVDTNVEATRVEVGVGMTVAGPCPMRLAMLAVSLGEGRCRGRE
jgi:hypothetical protein